jgi:hypothetical protein
VKLQVTTIASLNLIACSINLTNLLSLDLDLDLERFLRLSLLLERDLERPITPVYTNARYFSPPFNPAACLCLRPRRAEREC